MEGEPWHQAGGDPQSDLQLHLIDHDVCSGLQSAKSPVEHMMEFDNLTSHDGLYDWAQAPPYGFDDKLFGLGCDLDGPHGTGSICDFTTQGLSAAPGKSSCTTASMGQETAGNIHSPWQDSLEANKFLECSSFADFDANPVVNTDFMNSQDKCFFGVQKSKFRSKRRCPILRSSVRKSSESDRFYVDCIDSRGVMEHDCMGIWKETADCSESSRVLTETLHSLDDFYLQKNTDGEDDLEYISVVKQPPTSHQRIQRKTQSPFLNCQSLTKDEKPVLEYCRIMNNLPPEDKLKFARKCFKNVLNKASSDVVVKMKELQQKTEHGAKSVTPVSQLAKPKLGTKKPNLCPQWIAQGSAKKRKEMTKHGITIVTMQR